MFKVECPGCKAPYQVDERRVPASGLKMRCPKCGTSFQVEAPDDGRRTGPTPVLGGVETAAPQPPAPAIPRGTGARTIVGVAPSALGGTPPPQPQRPAAKPPAAPPPRPAAPAQKSPPKPAQAGEDPYGEVDLPSVSAAAPVDLPAAVQPNRPRPPAPPSARMDADLPAVAARKPAAAAPAPPAPPVPSPDADLPAVARRAPPAARADLGLDLPSPVAGRGNAPRAAPEPPARSPAVAPSARKDPGPAELDLDLPAPKAPEREWGVSEVGGSPSSHEPTAKAPLPHEFELDLPDLSGVGLPAAGLAGLPTLAAGLPAPAAAPPVLAAGLPMRRPTPETSTAEASLEGGVPPLEVLPPPGPPFGSAPHEAPGFGGAAAPPEPGFGELDLELIPPAGSQRQPDTFGEIDLPPPPPASAGKVTMRDALDSDPFGEASIPSQPHRPPSGERAAQAGVVRSAGGGTNYGEVNLDGGVAAEVAVEEPVRSARVDEDMEFGALPTEGPPQAVRPTGAATVSARASDTPPPRRRWPLRVFAGLLVLAVAGGSLAFVPSMGPYGVYWLSDRINAGQHERLLDDAVQKTRRAFANDTYPGVRQALADADATRASAKRYRPAAAYLAFVGYAAELRFGEQPAVRARSRVLLDELGPDSDARYAELARTARRAVEGSKAEGHAEAQSLIQRHAADPDVVALAAELSLRAGNAQAARSTFGALEKLEPSARAAFGAARAEYAAGSAAGARKLAEQTLSRNGAHVGAKILLARLDAGARESEAGAVSRLKEVSQASDRASPAEIVEAETLLGDIHLSRARVSQGLAAYGRALKLDPRAARALAGTGEGAFRAGRFTESLARFEASVQADPDDLFAQLGVAKSKLSLERVEEATKALSELAAKHTKEPQVAFWYGRALEVAGNRDRANAVYHAAIDAAPRRPELVSVYVALATLQNERGQGEEAQKTLARAKATLPESATIHRALGELALSQARHADAVRELERALELDPDDLAARFQLGVALRRDQRYDAASAELDKVAAVDGEYPGLALERGLIFEATGRADEALEEYEAALAKAPADPDLMLRVGCGSVAAGRAEQAEGLLRKVLMQRASSAETHHCLGRALLAQNKVADAQRMLDRAVDLDPKRAEYHLYAGWAANEADNFAKADKALATALALDSSLADAYWQRGALRARQGRGQDAVRDLTEALKRNPSRIEAHAALADAYYDLGREHEALAEWQKAVRGQPDNALWRFRYGKLLVTNQMNEAGRVELEQAIQAAQKMEAPPRWLWEAHHAMARALGARPEAATHWEQFLRLGPRDSPYRREAQQFLERAGRPYTGN